MFGMKAGVWSVPYLFRITIERIERRHRTSIVLVTEQTRPRWMSSSSFSQKIRTTPCQRLRNEGLVSSTRRSCVSKIWNGRADWEVSDFARVASQALSMKLYLVVIASVQPTHACVVFERSYSPHLTPSVRRTSDMWYAETRLGPQRIKGAYAYQTLLQ